MLKSVLILMIHSFLFFGVYAQDKKEKQEDSTDYTDFLQKQTISCPFEGCPEYLSKTVVFENTIQVQSSSSQVDARFCTSTLISPRLILTSGSCVGRDILKGIKKCSQHVFFVFPGLQNGREVFRRCQRVLDSTDSDLFINTKATWRNDFVLMEMDAPMVRDFPVVNEFGILSNENYTVWKINQIDKYKAKVVRQECTPKFNTYMNPFASNLFSPFIPFAECPFYDENLNGNLGAPVISGNNGKLMGLLSHPLSKDLIQSFLRNERLSEGAVSPMVHVTNVSCLNLGNSRQIDEECKKVLTAEKLKVLQEKLLHNEELFTASIAKISEEIDSQFQYLGYDLKILYTRDENNIFKYWYEARIYPKCFLNPQEWINSREMRQSVAWWKPKKTYNYEFNHNDWNLFVKFNKYLYPKVVLTKTDKIIENVFSFSPEELENSEKSWFHAQIPKLSHGGSDLNYNITEMLSCSTL